MEKIYEPSNYRASEHLPAKEYFEEYIRVCTFNYLETRGKGKKGIADKIQQEMGFTLSKDEFQELENSCNLNKLRISDEPRCIPAEIPEKLLTKTKLTAVYPMNASAKVLNVVKCREVLDRKHNLKDDFKFGCKRFLKTVTVVNKSKICDIPPGSTFVYTIIVYRPFSLSYLRNSTEKLRFAYEIEALGSNTLAEVADTIVCLANIALYKEVENTNEDLSPFTYAKRHYPSQSIFIDGIFYNDTRSSNCIDYSANLKEWSEEKGIGQFQSLIMEDTILENLMPRLGYPYVYMHQGNCEHIMVFSDARLIQPGDCLNSRKYPRITALSRASNVICFICGSTHSKWIVMHCEKFPQEKVFLCTGCCDSYLYVDGKKVTEFKLYPYYDQELLTRHLTDVELE